MQVLNGPQGTLFGRNTTGGAVLLVPAKPTNDLEGYVQAKLGNYDNREFEGVLNIPIVSEKVLLRVAGGFQDRDGFTRDVVWNKDRDNTHWYSGRASLTLKPTETLENYTMAYAGYSHTNGSGLIHTNFNIPGLSALGFCYEGPTLPGQIASCDVYRAATDEAEALGPRQTAHGVDDFSKTKTWGITNTTSLQLSDELTIKNIASYQRFNMKYSADSDGTVLQQLDTDASSLPAPGQVVMPGDGTPLVFNNAVMNQLPRDNFKVFTEELQIQGSYFDNNLDFTAGAFYLDQRPVSEQGVSAPFFCPAAFTGDPFSCPTLVGVRANTSRSRALYAQGALHLGLLTPALEGLKLTAGYRHTWDTVTGLSRAYYEAGPGAFVCVKDNALAFEPSQCEFSATLKTSEPTWLVGLDYRVSPDLLFYGKISRGYKSGGFNGDSVNPGTETFAPEFVTSYEAGLKTDFRIADIPTRFNATAYYTDYRGIQRATTDVSPAGVGGAKVTSADADIRGVELEASIRPFPGIEIGGNFSYTDAEFKRYPFTLGQDALTCAGTPAQAGSTIDISCTPFAFVAPYIYSVHLSAERDLGNDLGALSFFVNYAHSSSQKTSEGPRGLEEPGSTLEGYGLLSMSLDWRNVARSGIDVGLYATNLTNKLYRTSNGATLNALLYSSTLYGEPRMYGVRLRYSFGR